MFVGKVVGSVWSTVKWPEVEGLKLLAVQPYHLAELIDGAGEQPSCHDLVICADVLGAGVGEEVVVAYGHAARVALHELLDADEKTAHPVDAAVVAIIDRLEVNSEAAALAAADTAGGAGEV